ncbi:MAG: hypothetical protein ACI30I_06525 [Parabacteroides sp.]
MKRCIYRLLSIVVLSVGLISCGNNTKSTTEANLEEEAVIAGEVSRNLLTDELKTEVIQFLKNMPASDLVYQLSTGEVQISVANTDFLLPVSKVSDLNTSVQKARACGIYFADFQVLKALGKPTAELEQILVKLTTDLNVPFLVDIADRQVPANATKEEFRQFLKAQEGELIEAMMQNDKADIEIEMLGGLAVEYANIMANPGLTVKGNVAISGLTENMAKRLDVLLDITKDLSQYYPDMIQLGEILAPLKGMTTSVEVARTSQKDIEMMRASLLK